MREEGTTSFAMIQNASDGGGNAASLVFFRLDLLHLNGKPLLGLPLLDRKRQFARLLAGGPDHHIGPEFFEQAGKLGAEGVVSKRVDAPYVPGSCGSRPSASTAKSSSSWAVLIPRAAGTRLGSLLPAITPGWKPALCRPRGHRNARRRA